MAAMQVFDHEQITVWYHAEKNIIHHQMHQFAHGQVFRDALMAGLEAMKKYRSHKWLSDDQKNPVFDPEDQKWTADVWRPQVLEAGWKYWAIVQPERMVAKVRMEKLAEKYAQLGVTVKFFNDPDEALTWLEQQ